MLVIGHRGAAGIAPENTLKALKAGRDASADILEFDVRLTSDNIPVLSHDARLHGAKVSQTTLADLKKHGAVTTLQEVLDTFWGKVLLNVELKPLADIGTVYNLIKKYVKSSDDWDNVVVSSFHVRQLLALRKLSPQIHLALLHSVNPFSFITYGRQLQLSAVGWHRLHVNALAIEIAKRAGLFTYVYTVNRPDAVARLERRGIDGVVTDYPDRLNH